MIAFAYYGGKQSHLKDILPLLPEGGVDHFCDLFGGSAAVLLNRKPTPIETYNDLNGDIVNFFKVLRSRPEELIHQLELTPYSRQEFQEAWEETDDDIERARRWFVRVQMDVAKAGAKKDRGWSVNVRYCPGEHSSAVKNFRTKVPALYEVAARLLEVQMENRSAIDLIGKYDTKRTLFYLDPPYLPATRTSANDYRYELNRDQHFDLSRKLNTVKGMVALSGYDDPEMNNWYKGWRKVAFKEKQVPMSRGHGRTRQECLWLNYDPARVTRQLNLFYHQQLESNS